MTTTLRIDDALKHDCDLVLDDIGLNLSCAITIFLKELTRRRAMPFAVRASNAQGYVIADPQIAVAQGALSGRYREKQQRDGVRLAAGCAAAKEAIAELRASAAGGGHEWTQEEIDAEIAAARASRATN